MENCLIFFCRIGFSGQIIPSYRWSCKMWVTGLFSSYTCVLMPLWFLLLLESLEKHWTKLFLFRNQSVYVDMTRKSNEHRCRNNKNIGTKMILIYNYESFFSILFLAHAYECNNNVSLYSLHPSWENSIYFRNFHSYHRTNTTDLGTDIPLLSFLFRCVFCKRMRTKFSFFPCERISFYIMFVLIFPKWKHHSTLQPSRLSIIQYEVNADGRELNALHMKNGIRFFTMLASEVLFFWNDFDFFSENFSGGSQWINNNCLSIVCNLIAPDGHIIDKSIEYLFP